MCVCGEWPRCEWGRAAREGWTLFKHSSSVNGRFKSTQNTRAMVENEEEIIRWNYLGKNAQPGQFRAHYFPKENSFPSSRASSLRTSQLEQRTRNSFEEGGFFKLEEEKLLRYIERDVDFITIESSKDVSERRLSQQNFNYRFKLVRHSSLFTLFTNL